MNQRGLLAAVGLLAVLAASVSVYAYNQTTQVSALDEMRADLEAENIELEKASADLADEKAELITRVSGLEEQIVETQEQIDTLQQELSELESENVDLQDDLDAREATISSLRSELGEAQDRISELNDQIAGYLAQIAGLSAPLEERHFNSTLLATQDCSQCHGPVAEMASRNESNSYHNTHFNNQLLSFACTDCHKSVDISSTSENLTRLVDTETCKLCHTTFPVKIWMGNQSPPDRFALLFPSCVGCHTDWQNQMADASFVALGNVTEADCQTCHLKNPLFPTERKPIELPCTKCH